MKKYLVISIVLIIPMVASAAWWNPISWFDTNAKVNVTSESLESLQKEPHYAKYYIKYDNSKVRACKSKDCDVLGYYQTNDSVGILGPQTWNDLEEWVVLQTTETGQNGFLHKSLLSEVPISKIQPISNDSILNVNKDIEAAMTWIVDIDGERKKVNEFLNKIIEADVNGYSGGVIDFLEEYKSKITVIRGEIVNRTVSSGDWELRKKEILSYIKKYEVLKGNFNSEFNDVLEIAQKEIDIKNKSRERALNAYYREIRAEQDAVNQARIDMANAKASSYKAIMDTAKVEGVTQGVVNNQLNSAGLIRQVNCYTSPVGGMTPSGGSITCY